jgi:hypothetical protein
MEQHEEIELLGGFDILAEESLELGRDAGLAQ